MFKKKHTSIGFSSFREPNAEVLRMCDYIKPQVEEAVGRPLPTWEVISYSEQPAAGKNYRIKVHTGNEEYIHLWLFKPLPHRSNKPVLRDITQGMSKDSEFE